ncbi:uncharacterized protein LOC111402219 isoform X2 [Olea europaea var. sylvestris]|uniref:uncharacterized protein LOC111402219 isoform X2 n=1 Tax=Olea europaea var. sylvestris TaxID=158386 RepID=UPI000C1CFEF1|nr:uncharacterized protein LOC111402219 isoform X2 [Olea europaea var. sylvestris]
MAAPYRSREGLSTRSVGGGGNPDEIQLRIDPMHADFDEEVTGLRKQVRLLKNVAQDIESEAKFQNDFLNQLCFFSPYLLYRRLLRFDIKCQDKKIFQLLARARLPFPLEIKQIKVVPQFYGVEAIWVIIIILLRS